MKNLSISKIVKHWVKLSIAQKKICIYVLFYSIYNKILRALKFKNANCEYYYPSKLSEELTDEKLLIARDIRLAIILVDKFVPWKNLCRHQSWQAIQLLLKYKILYSYHVGFFKDTYGNLKGHSWVIVKNTYICGDVTLDSTFEEIKF
jgi:hypothetical protein